MHIELGWSGIHYCTVGLVEEREEEKIMMAVNNVL